MKATVENVRDCADDVPTAVGKIADKARQQGIRLREFFATSTSCAAAW